MASQDQVLPENHLPPKASSPIPEDLPGKSSTPATCRSTTAVPPQGSHPDTEHSATERVARSGRVVRLPPMARSVIIYQCKLVIAFTSILLCSC